MKTNFKSRPVYHYKDRRIKAHFLLCFIALLIYRILEKKADELGQHFTVSQIIQTLRNINVTPVKGDTVYTAAYEGGLILDTLHKISGIDLSFRFYQSSSLKKVLKKIL